MRPRTVAAVRRHRRARCPRSAQGERGFVRDLFHFGVAHCEAERRRPGRAPSRSRAIASPETIASSYERSGRGNDVGSLFVGPRRHRCSGPRRARYGTSDPVPTQRTVEIARVPDASEAGLEAEETAVRRRDPDRTAAVAPGADGHHSRRHCGGRTAGRAARRALGVPGIAGGAVQIGVGPVRRPELR